MTGGVAGFCEWMQEILILDIFGTWVKSLKLGVKSAMGIGKTGWRFLFCSNVPSLYP
ncbi:MAG: hypothetical protein WCF22_08930 [Candidatus Sulfotelmatobacter sp.]